VDGGDQRRAAAVHADVPWRVRASRCQETANNSDDPPADGIHGDHADQQECQHHQGCTALTVAVGPCDRNFGNADQKRNGEEHSAGPGKAKPVTEPSPIATECGHVRILGR
jgi:hypothetical protein